MRIEVPGLTLGGLVLAGGDGSFDLRADQGVNGAQRKQKGADDQQHAHKNGFARAFGRVGFRGQKEKYNKNSDIDLAIFTKSRKLDILESVMAIKGSLGSEAISLMKAGLPHSLSPIALDRGDAKAFKPFYFDLADYGIILYEKADSVSKFIDSVKWKKHRREVVKGVEVITW